MRGVDLCEIMVTACVSDELCRLLKEEEEEEDGQIVSLGIKRVRDRIAILSMLTVRVVVLEYSQLHRTGGFENVLRDAGIRAIPI